MGKDQVIFGDTDANAVEDVEDIVVKNAESTDIALGDVVFFDLTAADGISVAFAAAATNLSLCAGIALEAIKAGAYGRIRRRGTCQALVLGAATLAAGSTLKPVASQKYLTLGNPTHTPSEHNPVFVSWVAYTTTSAALKSVRVNL